MIRAPFRPTLLALAALLPAQLAHAAFIIDDFRDPAEIRLPDGPASVVTEGVGDLNASRSVSFRLGTLEPGQVAKAEIGNTAQGQFLVDIDEPRTRMYVDTEYSFALTDLTQGGANDAFFVEFTFAEGMITTFPQTGNRVQPPAVILIAEKPARPTLLVAQFDTASTSPFPRNQTPYTLIAPFERFTDQGGGLVNGDFTEILGFELWLFAHGGFGPWEVHIDSIRVGSMTAVPEPGDPVLAIIAVTITLAGSFPRQARFVRLLLAFAFAALAAKSAMAGFIIDDFTDPAEIQLPDGPSSVITERVGDLTAIRSISFREISLEPGQVARSDIATTAPGQYVVDVDDPQTRMYVDAKYGFGPTDFTEGGANDTILVDVTIAEGMITTFPHSGNRVQPPGVKLLAYTSSWPYLLLAEFDNSATSPFADTETPFTLIAPFDEFTDQGGGAVNGDFRNIYAFELWLFAHGGYGPWEVHIDSIRVGSMTAVPEPCTVAIAAILVICVLAVQVVPPVFSPWK